MHDPFSLPRQYQTVLCSVPPGRDLCVSHPDAAAAAAAAVSTLAPLEHNELWG